MGARSDGGHRLRSFFGDTDPVPAVLELLDSGELSWLPTTHLAGSDVEDPV